MSNIHHWSPANITTALDLIFLKMSISECNALTIPKDIISGLKVYFKSTSQAARRRKKVIFRHARSQTILLSLCFFSRMSWMMYPIKMGAEIKSEDNPGAADTAGITGWGWRKPWWSLWTRWGGFHPGRTGVTWAHWQKSVLRLPSRKTKSWAPVGWKHSLEENQKEVRADVCSGLGKQPTQLKEGQGVCEKPQRNWVV